MLRVSFWTMPFGLTEPLFVPQYWNPPTIFNLAQKTGFDIESFIFSFAIGGIGSVLYKIIFKMDNDLYRPTDRNHQKHKLHFYSLFTPVAVFLLLALLTNLNHIYCGIIALFIGAVAALFYRPDLKMKIWIGGILFLILYFIYFKLLNVLFHRYFSAVWNFATISGIVLKNIQIKQLSDNLMHCIRNLSQLHHLKMLVALESTYVHYIITFWQHS